MSSKAYINKLMNVYCNEIVGRGVLHVFLALFSKLEPLRSPGTFNDFPDWQENVGLHRKARQGVRYVSSSSIPGENESKTLANLRYITCVVHHTMFCSPFFPQIILAREGSKA